MLLKRRFVANAVEKGQLFTLSLHYHKAGAKQVCASRQLLTEERRLPDSENWLEARLLALRSLGEKAGCEEAIIEGASGCCFLSGDERKLNKFMATTNTKKLVLH